MKNWKTQALLERLVAGDRCEERGCHDAVVWLVTFNDETSHWCSRHTKIQMRNATRWEGVLDAKLESQTRS